jgi:hypothetical protein
MMVEANAENKGERARSAKADWSNDHHPATAKLHVALGIALDRPMGCQAAPDFQR